jgi:DNA-3-methyladenine glycosylase
VSCLQRSFYQRRTEVVAKDLIGKRLVRSIKKNSQIIRLSGIIVETEAYGYRDDPASHAYRGRTPRNQVMFEDVGKAYVYFTYGNHYCMNVSARSNKSEAGAVLIRGIEPTDGLEIMRQFRQVDNSFSLTSGPGKLSQALKIGSALNGIDITDQNSEVHIEIGIKPVRVITTPRIGITRAAERKWRFVDPSSPYVSRKTIDQALVTSR